MGAGRDAVTAVGAAGEPGELAELEALRGPLTGFCYRMLGAAADTDDAVQETLLRAYRGLGTFDDARGRLSTWVHRIAHNADASVGPRDAANVVRLPAKEVLLVITGRRALPA